MSEQTINSTLSLHYKIILDFSTHFRDENITPQDISNFNKIKI